MTKKFEEHWSMLGKKGPKPQL